MVIHWNPVPPRLRTVAAPPGIHPYYPVLAQRHYHTLAARVVDNMQPIIYPWYLRGGRHRTQQSGRGNSGLHLQQYIIQLVYRARANNWVHSIRYEGLVSNIRPFRWPIIAKE